VTLARTVYTLRNHFVVFKCLYFFSIVRVGSTCLAMNLFALPDATWKSENAVWVNELVYTTGAAERCVEYHDTICETIRSWIIVLVVFIFGIVLPVTKVSILSSSLLLRCTLLSLSKPLLSTVCNYSSRKVRIAINWTAGINAPDSTILTSSVYISVTSLQLLVVREKQLVTEGVKYFWHVIRSGS